MISISRNSKDIDVSIEKKGKSMTVGIDHDTAMFVGLMLIRDAIVVDRSIGDNHFSSSNRVDDAVSQAIEYVKEHIDYESLGADLEEAINNSKNRDDVSVDD